MDLLSQRIPVEDSIDSVYDLFYERGWTDGLPVIPPTEERVSRMLSSVRRGPQEVVAVLAPRSAPATVEKIAVNAVMAGCLPGYLPVVIAAVEAVAEERFNLLAIQATTHPCGTLIVVNGPVVSKLGIGCRGSAFGAGNRANATIGRALRLSLLNIGGAIPVKTSKSTHGSPARYSYCVAENEADSPWRPFHVDRGFAAGESTVTVFAAEGPHNINDHESKTGKGILTTAAFTMATAGNNNLTYYGGDPILMLGPEHAATVARDGFTKEQVRDFIWEHARLPVDRLSEENVQRRRASPQAYGDFFNTMSVPLAKREDILVMVVGGAGKHSCFIPTFGMSYSVTKAIDLY